MTAYLQDDINVNIFHLLSMILMKHNCKVIELDLISGILNIEGKNQTQEDLCIIELHKVFTNLMYSQEYD